MIRIYTDGGCLYQSGPGGSKGGKGPGGWGYRIELPGDIVQEEYGSDSDTTNNRMEMVGAIMALRWISVSEFACDQCSHRWFVEYGIVHTGCPKCGGGMVTCKYPDQQVTLFSDSQYLVKGITSWVSGWEKNGWKTKEGKPVQNQDLWMQLRTLDNLHIVNWQWVKGHMDNAGNIRADELATMGRHAAVNLTKTPKFLLVEPLTVEEPKAKHKSANELYKAVTGNPGMPPAEQINPKTTPKAKPNFLTQAAILGAGLSKMKPE